MVPFHGKKAHFHRGVHWVPMFFSQDGFLPHRFDSLVVSGSVLGRCFETPNRWTWRDSELQKTPGGTQEVQGPNLFLLEGKQVFLSTHGQEWCFTPCRALFLGGGLAVPLDSHKVGPKTIVINGVTWGPWKYRVK